MSNIANVTEVPIQMLVPTMPFPDSFRMSGRRTKEAAKFLDNVVLYRKFMPFRRTSCFLLEFFLVMGYFLKKINQLINYGLKVLDII